MQGRERGCGRGAGSQEAGAGWPLQEVEVAGQEWGDAVGPGLGEGESPL